MNQVLRTLGRIRTYLRRIAIWSDVARHVTGKTAGDRRILRRAILKAPLDALSNLDEWRDPHVDQDCDVRTSLGRFQIRANSDDLYLVLPSREPAVLKAICDLLRPGDCFVDAGANIGAYTVLAAGLVGNTGKVIAVEMMPDTAEILRRHVANNDCTNVDIVQFALSDIGGQFVLARVECGKFGSASIAVQRDGAESEVKTTTLANIIADKSRVRLIKMDLEGAELAAARGIGSMLDRIDYVLFEDWGDCVVSQWFSSNGFDVRRLDANNALAMSQSIREGRRPESQFFTVPDLCQMSVTMSIFFTSMVH